MHGLKPFATSETLTSCRLEEHLVFKLGYEGMLTGFVHFEKHALASVSRAFRLSTVGVPVPALHRYDNDP